MELDELKRNVDKDYQHNQVTREQSSDDLVFYHVTQWDDNLLSTSQLQFRGQFDILRKAGREILATLEANPVTVDFEPRSSAREEGADLLDGLYRSDDRNNSSIEAFRIGAQESVVCGYGAWMLYTEYETNQMGDYNQVIRRKPLYEANNKVFWDANAKLQDKSDAERVTIIHAYTEDAYREMASELLSIEPEEVQIANFKTPEQSYVFPWYSENDSVYVGEIFMRELVTVKNVTLATPMGEDITLREYDLVDVMDELLDGGYDIVGEKEVETYMVTRYLASGAEILDESVIAGENLPVVPVYGERGFVEDEEYYEGIVRLAKDPQRLRNFQMSYLADIVSRSPRPKPIFYPEQVQGFEEMYEESGADNNYPYLLQNRTDVNGADLPLGPVAAMPEQTMPQALAVSIELSRQAVEDVANPGLPQDIADPDLSGKAVYAIQNRLDNQTMVYQTNMKHAKRRDGEIYASMAAEVFDAPREVTLTLPDGQRKKVQVMEVVMDSETGNIVTLNDISNMEFDVYASVGPSYSSQKDQTRAEIKELMGATSPGTPEYNLLMLTYFNMVDGIDTKPIRDYANKQLVLQGFKEPETEEEMIMMQEAAAMRNQPDPAQQALIMEGQARIMEGQAAIQNEVNDANKIQIDAYKAETDRQKVNVQAAESGVRMDKLRVETVGQQIDNTQKVAQSLRKM